MEVVLEDFRQAVHQNATVTATGASTVTTDFGNKEVTLFINIKNAPTGTTPSITFTMKEVDPGDEATVVGTTKTGTALTAAGTQILTLPVTFGGSIQVSWTVTGTTPSFTGVFSTLVNKGTSPAIYDQSGNGPVAVKAASTAVVAGDPSLAVGLSPNSPLPSGTNAIGSVTATQATAANLNATVAQGAPNTLANKWSVQHTDGTNTQPTMDAVARKAFVALTDGTNVGAVKAASTAAVAADPSIVVALSPNSPSPGVADFTSTGALGALNAAVTITPPGAVSVGFQLATGTLIGTIVAEFSFDGGTTWNATTFDQNNKINSIVFASANTAQSGTLVGVGGAGQFRVRVSAYTSGTANITLRASQIHDPSAVYGGTPGSAIQPPTAAQIAGWDSATTTFRVPAVKASTTQAAMTDQALVVVISPNQSAIPVSSSPANVTTGIGIGTVTTSGTALTWVVASTYNEQTSNAQRSFKSSSTSDAGAGIGAQTITFTYLDQTGAGFSTETVTLNGTTAVNTVSTTVCYIEGITVTQVGSNGSNVGTLTMFKTTAGGGSTLATVNPGDNRIFWGQHYIPTGKTNSITGLSGNNNSASNGSIIILKAKSLTATGAVEFQISDYVRCGGGTAQPVREYSQLIQFTGPARIRAYSACEGSPTILTRVAFDYYDQ